MMMCGGFHKMSKAEGWCSDSGQGLDSAQGRQGGQQQGVALRMCGAHDMSQEEQHQVAYHSDQPNGGCHSGSLPEYLLNSTSSNIPRGTHKTMSKYTVYQVFIKGGLICKPGFMLTHCKWAPELLEECHHAQANRRHL